MAGSKARSPARSRSRSPRKSPSKRSPRKKSPSRSRSRSRSKSPYRMSGGQCTKVNLTRPVQIKVKAHDRKLRNGQMKHFPATTRHRPCKRT